MYEALANCHKKSTLLYSHSEVAATSQWLASFFRHSLLRFAVYFVGFSYLESYIFPFPPRHFPPKPSFLFFPSFHICLLLSSSHFLLPPPIFTPYLCLCQTHFVSQSLQALPVPVSKGLNVMYSLSVEGWGHGRPQTVIEPMSHVISNSPHSTIANLR